MLSDEVVEKVTERLAVRMEQANEYVLKEIGKSIEKLGTLSPSKAQQLVQLIKFGGSYKKIVNKLDEMTKLNAKEIDKIFQEVAKKDYQFAKQFYDYKGKEYIPWEENSELREQIKAISKITKNEYVNLTRASNVVFGFQDKNGTITYKGLKQTYYNLLDEAVLNVGQGKESFDSAMYRQLKEIGGGGIKVIYPTTYMGKDEDGNPILKNRVMRADSAVRMQMKGALRNMHNEIQEQLGEGFDADGVEISVHLNPAPDHELVQGRQFSKKQFEKFQNDEDSISYDGIEFPAISDETGRDRRAISQYNCYHYVFSIVLGVSRPQYTDEQLQQIINDNNKGFEFEGKHYTNYEGTQLQRKLETEIRKAKDEQIIGRASNNNKLIYESQERITQLTSKYKELSQASGLPTALDRARVSGYKRVKLRVNKSKTDSVKNISANNKNNVDLIIKDNQVFIPAVESKKLDEYFIKYYESQDKLRDFEKVRYDKLKERIKKDYNDELITVETFSDRNNLLERINAEMTNNTYNLDKKLMNDAAIQTYKTTVKCPALLERNTQNRFYIDGSNTMPEEDFAKSQWSGITVNNSWFSDYSKLSKEEKYLIKRKWHAEVAKGNEPYSIFSHELGHQIFDNVSEYIYKHINDPLYADFKAMLGKIAKAKPDGFRVLDEIQNKILYDIINNTVKKTNLSMYDIIDLYISKYGRAKEEISEMLAEIFSNAVGGKSNILGDELIKYLKEIGQWKE